MNRFDFQEVINELVESYPGCYPAKMIEKLWTLLQDLQKDQFQTVVDALIEQGGRAPNLAAIKARAKTYLDRIREAKRESYRLKCEREGLKCEWCCNTGLLEAYDRDDHMHQTYCFRCPKCEAEEVFGLSNSIPVFHEKYKVKHMPIRRFAPRHSKEKIDANKILEELMRSGVIIDLREKYPAGKTAR